MSSSEREDLRRILDRLEELIDKQQTRIQQFERFGQDLLLLLIDTSAGDTKTRLSSIFRAVWASFPREVVKRYLETAIQRAKGVGVDFTVLRDALLQGLGEDAGLVEKAIIEDAYGTNEAEEWERALKGRR